MRNEVKMENINDDVMWKWPQKLDEIIGSPKTSDKLSNKVVCEYEDWCYFRIRDKHWGDRCPSRFSAKNFSNCCSAIVLRTGIPLEYSYNLGLCAFCILQFIYFRAIWLVENSEWMKECDAMRFNMILCLWSRRFEGKLCMLSVELLLVVIASDSICQDRTICDLVRLIHNHLSWCWNCRLSICPACS